MRKHFQEKSILIKLNILITKIISKKKMILILTKALALECTQLIILAANRINRKLRMGQKIPLLDPKKIDLEKLNKNTWIHIII